MSRQDRKDDRNNNKPVKRKPLLLTIIYSPVTIFFILLGGLIMSIFISIIIEWIGLSYWWPDQPDHAYQMFTYEYNAINDDFKTMIKNYQPIQVINVSISYMYDLLYNSAFTQATINWLNDPNSSGMGLQMKRLIIAGHTYISSAGYIILTITMRAVVFILSLPWFVLCGALGAVNGLVEREIRKDEGGLEHAYVHHLVKDHKYLFINGAWVLYLAIPWSIHPSYLLIPAGLLFSYTIYLTMWTFKKYL